MASVTIEGNKRKPTGELWQVIVLSKHVDLWNRLGWKDPFTQERASRRVFGAAAIKA